MLGFSEAIIPREARVLTLPFHTEKLPGSCRRRMRRERKAGGWGLLRTVKETLLVLKIETELLILDKATKTKEL